MPRPVTALRRPSWPALCVYLLTQGLQPLEQRGGIPAPAA